MLVEGQKRSHPINYSLPPSLLLPLQQEVMHLLSKDVLRLFPSEPKSLGIDCWCGCCCQGEQHCYYSDSSHLLDIVTMGTKLYMPSV